LVTAFERPIKPLIFDGPLVKAAGVDAQDELVMPAAFVNAVTVIVHEAVPLEIASAETPMVPGAVSVTVPLQPAPKVATAPAASWIAAGRVSVNARPATAGFPAMFWTVNTKLTEPPATKEGAE
jgi:hypothetical protein